MNINKIKFWLFVGFMFFLVNILVIGVFRKPVVIDEKAVVHKDLPGLGKYYEIGWLTVVGDQIVNHEPESSADYVVVCLGNRTNDLEQLRPCHVGLINGIKPILITDMVWYDRSTRHNTQKSGIFF